MNNNKNDNTIVMPSNNVFLSSVESFSSDDIKDDPDKDKIKSIYPLVVRAIIMAISIGVFCFSVYSIALRIADDKKQENIYSSLRPDMNAESAIGKSNQLLEPNRMLTLLEMINANGKYDDYKEDVLSDAERYAIYRQSLLKVMAENPDTYGWIVFTGTKIDYPIMLGEDNSYYLNHNYKGIQTKAGSIFADMSLWRNHQDNYNALIYGHCMTNGSMFRGIKLWYDSANRNTLADNMKIEIITKDSVYVYKLFSAYRSDDFSFTKTNFKDSGDYKQFLDSIYKRSALRKRIPYSEQSKICTLVTCTNVKANPDERYVVHGILDKIVPYEKETSAE